MGERGREREREDRRERRRGRLSGPGPAPGIEAERRKLGRQIASSAPGVLRGASHHGLWKRSARPRSPRRARASTPGAPEQRKEADGRFQRSTSPPAMRRRAAHRATAAVGSGGVVPRRFLRRACGYGWLRSSGSDICTRVPNPGRSVLIPDLEGALSQKNLCDRRPVCAPLTAGAEATIKSTRDAQRVRRSDGALLLQRKRMNIKQAERACGATYIQPAGPLIASAPPVVVAKAAEPKGLDDDGHRPESAAVAAAVAAAVVIAAAAATGPAAASAIMARRAAGAAAAAARRALACGGGERSGGMGRDGTGRDEG